MFSFATKTAAAETEVSAADDLRSDLDQSAKDAKRATKDFSDKASDYADEARDQIRDFADRTRHDLKKAAQHANDHVRGKPMQSALTMLAVGLVLGMILRGARRA